MIENFLFLLVCASAVQGAQEGYLYSEQANGWLKYYQTPATWVEAKIRCDSDGAVLASPLFSNLQDAIMQLINQQNSRPFSIYTGVQAKYQTGNFYSIEGSPISSLSVPLDPGPPTTYTNGESCVVWDVVYTRLIKVRCDTRQPSVCYKMRTTAKLPDTQTVITPPEFKMEASPKQPDQPTETDQLSETNQQSNPHQQTNNQPQPTQQGHQTPPYQPTQTNQWSQTNQNPQTNQWRPPNSESPTNPQQPTTKRPQTNINPQEPTTKRQGSPTTRKSINKCTADGKTLIIINSNLNLAALKALTENDLPATIIFTDLAYIRSKTRNGTQWVAAVQNLQQVVTPSSGEKIAHNTDKIPKDAGIRPNNTNMQPEDPRNRAGNLPAQEQQSRNSGYSPITQQMSVVQGKIHYQPHRTNLPDAPQLYGQYDQPKNITQPEIQSNPVYTKPVANLNYLYSKQADGWLKMHQPATWDQAITQCASEGAFIASPLTTPLRDAIKLYVTQVAGPKTFYSGVRANFTSGDFNSIEGVALSRMPVVLGQGAQINYQSSETCIVMNTHSDVVTSVQCTDVLPYVCYRKRTIVIGCDKRYPGYSYEPRTGSCYKFHLKPKTWQKAYEQCSQEQGYLAITNSLIENQALMDIFAKHPSNTLTSYYRDNIYVGRRDWLDGRSWVTVKGQSLAESGFIGWAQGEPNNAGGRETCGTMGRRGVMYDDPCDYNLCFICEKKSEVFDNITSFGSP